MLWRILAVWLIADAAIVACLGSGSQIATRLHSAATEMQPKLTSLAVGRVERIGLAYALLVGLAYALLASRIGLAIFPPYGSTAASTVFVSAALVFGLICRFTATMGFDKTLQRLLREESVTEPTPSLF